MWKLDFPGVTLCTTDLFVHASLGNIDKIQGILSTDAGAFNVIDTIALQFRQITSVSLLIDQGADMYVQDYNKKTPLDTFYENYFITNHENRMETLLPLFEKYDVCDDWNLKQIHLIILGLSSVSLVTYLSVSIDEVDVFDSWGRTPLMWAAWRGDSESVTILLDHSADPQATSFDGNSVLIYATQGGNLECLSLILDTGTNINHTSGSLLTPARGPSELGDSAVIAKTRLIRGAAIEASRHQKFTPLFTAILAIRVESVAFLLERGASTQWSDWNCSDPLALAISFNNHHMVEALIQHGANLNTAPAFTVSYLRSVAIFGVDEKMLRLLLGAKPAIDIDLRDPQGCTASDRMQERLASMNPSDPRKDGLAGAFQELVDVCAEELDKLLRLLEYSAVEEVLEEDQKVGQEPAFVPDGLDIDDTSRDDIFHDALEDQDTQGSPEPLSPSTTASGVHSTDWALHRRSPNAGVPDVITEWTMKRSPTATYQDSGHERSSFDGRLWM
ncbi:MAG: hypothetical protein Q9168_007541 [Polycauliona sp. 1 TL-2023]